ncbi:MAG: reverse transcriptase domain-containing protein, partial [Candidatus Poseidoniaceae archaeon]
MDTIDDEDFMLDQFVLHACIQSDPGEPTKWREAFEGLEREWWIKSATAEFNNFLSRGAWKFVPRQYVLDQNRKLIPTKLVFKKKDEIDGSIRFKTRDVTLGYMMIPGVDFTERFSPVATDASLRIQIAINLANFHIGWITQSCDVEAAFLEATMDVEMFIEPHPAMVVCGFMTEKQRKETAIQLVKSMYGNVDAAIKFFKILTKHLTDQNGMKMKQSLSDPCVFYKLNNDGNLILMVSITVDDCAITGLNEDIEWFMDGLEKRFKITRDGIISKHLGVTYKWGTNNQGKAYCKATMDKKVNAIVDYYENHIGKPVKEASTPGLPNENLVKNENEPVDIDPYRSLVGKIMFFSTKICPKIGAAVRALSAHMSNPSQEHWKAMDRLVGYIKGMNLKGIYYLEPSFFNTVSLADTDYGNCRETRRSVGCSLITIGGCLVDWWMAKHHSVSDSSCEAEYKELAKCAKGVKFVQMMLGELNLLQLPGYIGEDNKGAIFLAYSKQV